MADGFLFLLDLAAAVYAAVDTAHGNRQQCALVAERVHRIMDELSHLSPGDQRLFSASPCGSALAQTLQAAAALCNQFERKSWLKRVLSSSEHAAQFVDIQGRLDRVVVDANLAATLGTATRQRAQEQDAADARVLTVMLLSEQRAGFNNLAAGQGKLAGMLDLGLISLQDQVASLKSMMTHLCKEQERTTPTLEHAFQLHWGEIVIDTEIHEDGYCVPQKLGSGGFGVVFAGRFRAEPRAIKELNLDTPKAKKDFLAECVMLSRLHHPNICNFYGNAVNAKGTRGRMVIERLDCTLVAVVHNPASVDRAPLTDPGRMRLTSEVAQGLAYLHTTAPAVVHHDLKPHNVMLTAKGTAKIIDFGLARVRTNSMASSTKMSGIGTLQYMAPEMLQGQAGGGRKADVYAFGMVVYEMWTGTVPFSGLDRFQLERRLLAHVMPDIPAGFVPEHVHKLVRACWRHDPASRPDVSIMAPLLACMVSMSSGAEPAAPLTAQLALVLQCDKLEDISPSSTGQRQRCGYQGPRGACRLFACTDMAAYCTRHLCPRPGCSNSKSSSEAACCQRNCGASDDGELYASVWPGEMPNRLPCVDTVNDRLASPAALPPLPPGSANPLSPRSADFAAIKDLVEQSGLYYERCQLEVTGVAVVSPIAGFNPGNLATIQAFHGTPEENVDSIITEGFRKPTAYGAFGQALYFSRSAKTAVWYCRSDEARLLVCTVAVGHCLRTQLPDPGTTASSLRALGYDSVAVPAAELPTSLLEEEVAVFDASAASVTHVVHVKVRRCPELEQGVSALARYNLSPDMLRRASVRKMLEFEERKEVVTISLEQLEITPEVFVMLGDMLQKRSIKFLCLCFGNTLTRESLQALSEMLRAGALLEKLLIRGGSGSVLSSTGLLLLARGIAVNDALRTVMVPLGPRDAPLFFTAAQQNTNVTYLVSEDVLAIELPFPVRRELREHDPYCAYRPDFSSPHASELLKVDGFSRA